VYLDGSGAASIVAADIDGGSSDNCGVASLAASVTSYSCVDVGANNVTLTVEDVNGNVSTCVAVVTVNDTIAPSAVCQNIDVYLDGSGAASIVAADIDGGSADNCGIASTVASQTSFSCSDVGVNNITLTVTDVNGNASTCVAVVTVNDTVTPTISCPADQSVDFSSNCDYTIIDFTSLAAAADNCSGLTVTQLPVIGTVITGTCSVTLYAADPSGNVDSCQFNVIPSDNTPPDITCPADQNEVIDANCEFMIPDYTFLAVTSDNCSASISVTQAPTPGTIVSTGTTAIVLTADDGNGNTSDGTFSINVADTIAPALTCPSDQTATFDLNCAYTLPDYTVMATAVDNCGVPSIVQSPVAGTLVTGNTAITLTADDGNGNMTSCTFNLELTDIDAPEVICSSDQTILLDGNCEALLPDYSSITSVIDNCDGSPTVVQTPAPGTRYNDEGGVYVQVLATDASGNSDSCEFFVSIIADGTSGCLDNVVVSDLLSPNGDGKNDFWVIHEPSYIAGCNVLVFNRWGQKVFESKNYDNTWGGTYNNEVLPDGSYYYIIECDGEIKYKGALTILKLTK
jgi:gliding motility-associated-like protein